MQTFMHSRDPIHKTRDVLLIHKKFQSSVEPESPRVDAISSYKRHTRSIDRYQLVYRFDVARVRALSLDN